MAYAVILEAVLPNAAAHVLVASIISAPAGILLARIMIPEVEEARARLEPGVELKYESSMDALTRGVQDGLMEAVNVAAFLWQKQGTSDYITNKQKFQLAFPQMPLAMSNGLIHSAYIKVYTDIIGLDIKYVGIIWMLFSIWNAINDPLMGVFMDRFRYKPQRDKYTYILKVTAPVTLLSSAALLYAQPDWPTWVVFGFLTVLLFIYDTTQTGFAIAYNNYILIAAPTSAERVDVSVVNMYAGQIGAFPSMIIPTLLLVGEVDKTLVFPIGLYRHRRSINRATD